MKTRKEENYEGRKTGKIYLQTARQLLRKYYFESPANEGTCKNIQFMTEERFQELLKEADFCRLEGLVDTVSYLDTAIDTIELVLRDYKIDIPKNFREIVLFSENPELDLKACRSSIEELQFNNGEKGAIAYAVMINVHDLLTWNFSSHFFLKYRLRQNYQFLPLELTGLDFYERHYEIYVKPTLEALSLAPDMLYVDRAYTTQQDAFLAKYNIHNFKTLIESFDKIDYDAWTPNLRDAIRQNPETRSRLASQVLRWNPVLR